MDEPRSYRPRPFRLDDAATLRAFLEEHPFGTLITAADSGDALPMVSQIPVRVHDEREGRCTGHLARANPQSACLDGRAALLLVLGPHAYVSPRWYGRPDVPTWNYAAVEVRGTVHRLEGAAGDEAVRAQLAGFEAPDTPAPDEERFRGLLHAVVPFELRIASLQGKFKLSQNRSPEDRARVRAALAAGSALEAATAELMARFDPDGAIEAPEDPADS